jgi:hypothetical protein
MKNKTKPEVQLEEEEKFGLYTLELPITSIKCDGRDVKKTRSIKLQVLASDTDDAVRKAAEALAFCADKFANP